MVNHVQKFCFLFGESRSIFFINAEHCRTLLRWNSDVVDTHFLLFFMIFFLYTVQKESFNITSKKHIYLLFAWSFPVKNSRIKHTSTYFKVSLLLGEWTKEAHTGHSIKTFFRSKEKISELSESSSSVFLEMWRHEHSSEFVSF